MIENKIQPPFLKPGDEVAIISPSYCLEENILIEAAACIESWQLKVRIGKNARNVSGPFAGSDDERLSDLQEMTNDPDIRAVFCSRGGYGLLRIINRVDFSVLREAPKWYSGFSDVTVLQSWLSEVCGIMSIHGEMPLNFKNAEKTDETFSSLKMAFFGELKSHEWSGTIYRPANVSGEITGGNLSLIYSLSGTKAEMKTNGKILFIEEVGEYYYHLDRMLSSLKLSGKLDSLSALIVGGMKNIEESRVPWGKSIEETILGIVSEYSYPVLFNFPAGHISDNRAFYIGKQAKIEVNGNKAVLRYD
jgi:muramoyltetrapeptide carboxypeptidase